MMGTGDDASARRWMRWRWFTEGQIGASLAARLACTERWLHYRANTRSSRSSLKIASGWSFSPETRTTPPYALQRL